VNSCILYVLHDAADYDLVAVGDGIDVSLVRILEEAIDENRPILGDARCALEVILERR
jgi:hypothetical protein